MEKKKIKELLPIISFEGPPSETQKRSHLCPICTKRLEEEKYTCLLTIEKAISVYHSNHFIKEYIPVEKEITAVA